MHCQQIVCNYIFSFFSQQVAYFKITLIINSLPSSSKEHLQNMYKCCAMVSGICQKSCLFIEILSIQDHIPSFRQWVFDNVHVETNQYSQPSVQQKIYLPLIYSRLINYKIKMKRRTYSESSAISKSDILFLSLGNKYHYNHPLPR